MELRRWQEGEVLGEHEMQTARAPADRRELPGASEVGQAMRSLQAPQSGPATRLDDGVGARMSRLFGVDLTGTRVVPASPVATGATKAVTKDGEVHFRAGAYRPGTPDGDWLIAHELAHVVQQRGGRAERAGTPREIEREADRAATFVARGWFAPIALRAQPSAAYAFHEGEAHDEVGDEVGDEVSGDTNDARRDSPEGVDAKAHEPASQPEDARHATDAGADGHEDGGEHDALAADEHAISAPLPAEDAPGTAPAGGGGPAPKPQEAQSVAAAKPEAGLAQLHGVRPDKLMLLFGQVHTANAVDASKARAAQKANPPRQLSTGEAAAPAGTSSAKPAAGGPAGGKAAAGAASGDAAAAKDPAAAANRAAGAPEHPVKAEVPGGEAAKKTQQDQATAQREAVTQVIDAVKRSISSWFGSLFGHGEQEGDARTPKMSEDEARRMSGSVDQLPTTASDVSTDTGP
ncbi:MAG TPA: DUF4157 domain-containing protein, partial [Kofleriaceae bacterium]|nr:DUF4157 domain-containing protein [Kofleriaceae bacterium]